MQAEILIDGKKPDPALGLVQAVLDEGLNRISTFDLLLACPDNKLVPSEKLGKTLVVKLSEEVDGQLKTSRFDGLIFEFGRASETWANEGLWAYRLLARPRVWTLSFFYRSRIFNQNQSAVEVVNQVLSEDSLQKDTDFKTDYLDQGVYGQQEQIVQYQETDLDFVRRLLVGEGVNFFFSSDQEGQTPQLFHLVDDRSFFSSPFAASLPYQEREGLVTNTRHVTAMEASRRTAPGQVQVKFHKLLNPSQKFEAERPVPQGLKTQVKLFGDLGLDQKAAEHQARVRSQEMNATQWEGRGHSNVFLVRAGDRFGLDPDPFGGQDQYLATRVIHRFRQAPELSLAALQSSPEYDNSFWVVLAEADYRPAFLGRLLGASG
ncbi:MAG: phage late control D family protein [Deltaproteobacteria bacterium]|nr:phage late control D family protein [Deltaproteobacteria bacterium]